MANGITVTGIEDVRKILEGIAPNHSRNLMRATIHGMAQECAKIAKAHAPKDKGTLKRAIIAKRKRGKPNYPISEVIVRQGGLPKFNAFYWRFVEFGTKGRSEHPFIRPARVWLKTNHKNILEKQFATKLEKALTRAKKKR